jgi:hypothetical protein
MRAKAVAASLNSAMKGEASATLPSADRSIFETL